MTANWKTQLIDGFDDLIKKDCPTAQKLHEGKQACWTVSGRARRLAVTLEFGKRSTIPEVAIGIYQTDISDDYTVTSPAAVTLPFYPKWSSAKHLAGLSDQTNRIREKNKYLYWRLSPTRAWSYICNEQQSQYFIQEIAPQAIAVFCKHASELK